MFVAFADGFAKVVSFKHDPGTLFDSLDRLPERLRLPCGDNRGVEVFSRRQRAIRQDDTVRDEGIIIGRAGLRYDVA